MAERKGRVNPIEMLSNPDDIGVSEYRAIYECISDALHDTPDEEKKAQAIAMLEEFEGWAMALKKRIEKL